MAFHFTCDNPWQTENNVEMEHISVAYEALPLPPSSLVTQALCYVVFKPFCDVVLLLLSSIHFPQKILPGDLRADGALLFRKVSTFAECLITLFCQGPGLSATCAIMAR